MKLHVIDSFTHHQSFPKLLLLSFIFRAECNQHLLNLLLWLCLESNDIKCKNFPLHHQTLGDDKDNYPASCHLGGVHTTTYYHVFSNKYGNKSLLHFVCHLM